MYCRSRFYDKGKLSYIIWSVKCYLRSKIRTLFSNKLILASPKLKCFNKSGQGLFQKGVRMLGTIGITLDQPQQMDNSYVPVQTLS